MSNVLSEAHKQQVLALGRMGWSLRRIERDTGINRDTVARYLREAGVRQVLEPKRTLRNRSGLNVRCRRQGSRQAHDGRPGSATAASRL